VSTRHHENIYYSHQFTPPVNDYIMSLLFGMPTEPNENGYLRIWQRGGDRMVHRSAVDLMIFLHRLGIRPKA